MLVLFDLKGTLVDDVPRATRATNSLLEAPLSEEQFRASFVLPLADFMAVLGVDASGVDRWNAAMAAEPAPAMPGAHELLAELRSRGVRTGVVSAAGSAAVSRDLAALGLADLLDVVHADVADKAAVLRAEKPYLYVGDTAYDVAAANAAGVTSVAFTGGYSSEAALRAASPALVIGSLTDLL